LFPPAEDLVPRQIVLASRPSGWLRGENTGKMLVRL
jgi:hypothetical protein